MTFGELKAQIRLNLFASGEAPNLVAAHNKAFVDCLIDLQTAIDCLQSDNTSIFPQCATFYNCGLTVLPAPRGNIKKVSIIDQIDPTTHRESTTADTDYCSEIPYNQVDACHVRNYYAKARRFGCCPSPAFFGLWWGSRTPPVPTDAGLPAGLKPLPLGYHYPQTSTDRTNTNGDVRWRAGAGIWAIERGKIYVAPWIQSTESVLIIWDGIKRTWGDNDAIDDDPLLSEALESWVRWKHAENFDHDYEAAAAARMAYEGSVVSPGAKQKLLKQCRDETRVRECEPSHARSSASSITALFYNDEQSGSASCPDGSNPVTVTIPAGTVASTISVADANQRAKAQAETQAQAQLDCTGGGTGTTFENTNAGETVTVSCDWDGVSPVPDGDPVTVTIPHVTSTISVADANNNALSLAQSSARAQLHCTWWNSAKTGQATCSSDPLITTTASIAARTYSSNVSQADADAQAQTAADAAATALLSGAGCSGSVYWNTEQKLGPIYVICNQSGDPVPGCLITLRCTVPAHTFSAQSQSAANQQAQNMGLQYIAQVGRSYCVKGKCGVWSFDYGAAPL